MEINLFELMDNSQWFPYHRSVAQALGDDPLAAVMLSYLISRHNLHERAGELTTDGFFYRTSEAITEDTRFKKTYREDAIKTLKKYGLIEVSTRSVPGKEPGRYIFHAVRHFRVCRNLTNRFAEIRQTDMSKSDKPICRNPTASYILEEYKLENIKREIAQARAKALPFSVQTPDVDAPPVPAPPPAALSPSELKIQRAYENCQAFLKTYPAQAGTWMDAAQYKMTPAQFSDLIMEFCRENFDVGTFADRPENLLTKKIVTWMRQRKNGRKPTNRAQDKKQAIKQKTQTYEYGNDDL